MFMKFGTLRVFKVNNPKITLKIRQNLLLLNRALCFSAWCTYPPFPKMVPLGSQFFFFFFFFLATQRSVNDLSPV